MRDAGGLDQEGNRRGVEKKPNAGYIFKTPIAFAGVGERKRRGSRSQR